MLDPADERTLASAAQELLVEAYLADRRGLRQTAQVLAGLSIDIAVLSGAERDFGAAREEAQRRSEGG